MSYCIVEHRSLKVTKHLRGVLFLPTTRVHHFYCKSAFQILSNRRSQWWSPSTLPRLSTVFSGDYRFSLCCLLCCFFCHILLFISIYIFIDTWIFTPSIFLLCLVADASLSPLARLLTPRLFFSVPNTRLFHGEWWGLQSCICCPTNDFSTLPLSSAAAWGNQLVEFSGTGVCVCVGVH